MHSADMLVMNSFREITNTACNSLYTGCEEQLLLALSLPLPCCGACVSLPALEAANHPSVHWRCRAGAQAGPPACNELTTARDGREGSPWQCSDPPESCKSCWPRCWPDPSPSLRALCVPGHARGAREASWGAAPAQGPGPGAGGGPAGLGLSQPVCCALLPLPPQSCLCLPQRPARTRGFGGLSLQLEEQPQPPSFPG